MEKVQNVNTSGPELSDLENESTGVRKETHAHLVSLFHKIIYKTTKMKLVAVMVLSFLVRI